MRGSLSALVFLGGCLFPLCALAAPNAAAADRALATDLFNQARVMVANGSIQEACPRFAESQRLDPSLGTLLNLANCHELEGKLATAWTEFTEALALAERERQTERVAFAEAHIAALAPRLPRLPRLFPLTRVSHHFASDGIVHRVRRLASSVRGVGPAPAYEP